MRGKSGLFCGRPSPPNPPFSAITALLHMEFRYGGLGGNGETDDSSQYQKQIGFNNGPILSYDQHRFGLSSLQLSGVKNQRIFVRFSETIGTNDLTLEFWIYLTALPSSEVGLARWANGFEIRLSDSLYVANVNTNPFSFSTYSNLSPWTPALNTWHHIAACRQANNLRMFVNGSQLGVTANLGDNYSFPSGNHFFGAGSNLNSITGFYDEARVTRGYDLYSDFAPFVVPKAPFPDS